MTVQWDDTWETLSSSRCGVSRCSVVIIVAVKVNRTLMSQNLNVPVLRWEGFNILSQDFPGGAVVKTLLFHCKGHRFDPCSGN